MEKLTDSARLARVERIVGMLAAERFGALNQLGPMDGGWAAQRHRVQQELAAIAREQAEAPMETRGVE
jgi:hypothetical protein